MLIDEWISYIWSYEELYYSNQSIVFENFSNLSNVLESYYKLYNNELLLLIDY